MAKRIVQSEKNVWIEAIRLTVENKALNLGQGFPDFLPPKHVRQALVDVGNSENPFLQQYTRPYGHPRLVKVISETFSPIFGRTVDAYNEILITPGAYGALYYCSLGLINPGDEVIIIEPYFDCYEPMVRMAGGTPVFVPLRPTGENKTSADWKLNKEEFASKFNKNTRALFFNTPNNPLGKVYTKEELQFIADVCIKHDVLVFADEVYEWLTFQPNTHIKIATLPGMWNRTITVGSGGKTFSATGWKLGWAIAPDHLLQNLKRVFESAVNSMATPLQEAMAVAFETELRRFGQSDCYYNQLATDLVPKMERLARLLREIGMVPIIPEGGYFMMADYTRLYNQEIDDGDKSDDPKDFKFFRWMIKQKKLATIPPSAFYCKADKHLGEPYLRFCFIKDDETLDKVETLIMEWKSQLKPLQN